MSPGATKHYDVIIVGAGPVGLFLALELARADVSVLILERNSAMGGPWKEGPLGLRGLHIPSIEAFYRRGLLGDIVTTFPRAATGASSDFKFAGHFGGMLLDANNVDFSRWKYHLSGPAYSGRASSLGRIEAVLSEEAQNFGVEILRGREVTELHSSSDNVRVVAGAQEFTAQWLVGCDGGRSTIRKMAGFDFVGTDAEFTMYLTMCELDRPELLKPGFTRTKHGMYIVAQPGQIYALDHHMDYEPRTRILTPEHLQCVLQRVSETDVQVKAINVSSVTIARSKQATEYRRGRVLLAGDSAHIHSPLGAQGMNTGIADAMNLGWKLAATVKGTAAPGVLDSYHNERHPVAARVLEWTRAQYATLRPDPASQALAQVVQALLDTKHGTTFFVERIWSLAERYDLGHAHDLIGRSAPDFEFADGQHLGDKMHSAHFLLVDCVGDAALADMAQSLSSAVDYVAAQPKVALGIKALLVRPDGVVAWVAEDHVDAQSCKSALSQWLAVA